MTPAVLCIALALSAGLPEYTTLALISFSLMLIIANFTQKTVFRENHTLAFFGLSFVAFFLVNGILTAFLWSSIHPSTFSESEFSPSRLKTFCTISACWGSILSATSQPKISFTRGNHYEFRSPDCHRRRPWRTQRRTESPCSRREVILFEKNDAVGGKASQRYLGAYRSIPAHPL